MKKTADSVRRDATGEKHYCEVDHNIENPPCGKSATIRVRIGDYVMWMCADCYDVHERLMTRVGLFPESDAADKQECAGKSPRLPRCCDDEE